MNIPAIQGFLNPENAFARAQAYQYFEQLKESDDGWKLSIDLLTNGTKQPDEVKFFCFQVISHYVKTKYPYVIDTGQQLIIREFVKHWIKNQSYAVRPDVGMIQNKAAQIICLAFLADYPSRWPSFFNDLLQLAETSPMIYLKILLAINSEIADREIPRSQKDLDKFTLIKDTMRETCIPKLVDSWHHFLVTYPSLNADLVCLCLDVIGSYISWIDIGFIANDRFVSLFMFFLTVSELRESTCDCISQIISKGMDPLAKVKLVESCTSVLNEAGVLKFTGSPDDEDFIVKLSSMVNTMGTTLFNSWTRLRKSNDSRGAAIAATALHDKTELLLKFLGNDDDEVSQGVIEFAREYLQFLKQTFTDSYCNTIEAILYIVINKYKYDVSTDFNCQGQEEASFQDYRKSLKVIFDNLTLLDMDHVFSQTKNMITTTLNQWRNRPYNDIEVAITFLYLLGEAIPNSQTAASNIFGQNAGIASDKKSEINEMLHLLVTSGVSRHGHMAVNLQFFETVVRFEKFFSQEPQHIPEILATFLDERGLRNNHPHVRSRCSYLFSRFVKYLKSQMVNYTEEILKQLQDLLVLALPVNGVNNALLSPDDQLYLYETVAILIVSGNFDCETKQIILKSLLLPVAEKFELLLQKLPVTSDETQRHEIAKCMNHAIAVTSRTSKAFSNQQTMKLNGCVDVYLQALQVFLGALNLPYEQATLQSAVRQYLHRMVVCLESEVLPYFPIAAEQLLKSSDIRSIQEFIPLINQMIGKFKKDLVPFVQQIFLAFVTSIFNALSVPIDENDQPAQSDRQLLQRSYFLFIAAIVTNNIAEVIAAQDTQNMEKVLLTVIQGAVDFPDPVAQKTCFSILRRMVELWGGRDGMTGFVDFTYHHIVPACFMAPLKNTFDLNDAQTILALSESALCLKTILDKRGTDELVTFLKRQYLPKLNVAPSKIDEYCEALSSDSKAFKNYLKFFFQHART